MFGASVLKSESMRSVIAELTSGRPDQALVRLDKLKDVYTADPHSRVEIDRWRARALTAAGRHEEALRLLVDLDPSVDAFNYDSSVYCDEITAVFVALGRYDDLMQWCNGISGSIRTNDALGHLDWILRYSEGAGSPRPTYFMYLVLCICAIQLGITPPPVDSVHNSFQGFVRQLIQIREQANRRFGEFHGVLSELVAKGGNPEDIRLIVDDYIRSEGCPLFQEHAREAIP